MSGASKKFGKTERAVFVHRDHEYNENSFSGDGVVDGGCGGNPVAAS